MNWNAYRQECRAATSAYEATCRVNWKVYEAKLDAAWEAYKFDREKLWSDCTPPGHIAYDELWAKHVEDCNAAAKEHYQLRAATHIDYEANLTNAERWLK